MSRPFVTSLETYCGNYVDYLEPTVEGIELADIARGLAQTCRFGGQTTRFYSVAEHAVYVRRLVIEAGRPELGMAALHHDDHEAYVGDWPSPMKMAFDSELYREITERFDAVIGAKFEIAPGAMKHPEVVAADVKALRHEAATLKWSHGVGQHWGFNGAMSPLVGIGWGPDRAEREYLKAHYQETTHEHHD